MSDYIDLTNERFGRLVVLKKGKGRKTVGGQYKATWICQCDCGNTVEIDGEKLRRGHTTSCGCKKKEYRNRYFEDLIGQRFGRLTVVAYIPPEKRTARQYNWWCRCDCGNEIKANASKLKGGLQQSCGCLKRELQHTFIADKTRKYKHSNKRLYGVYQSMMNRCYDARNREYENYGGRGIEVCDEWRNNYDTFAEWAWNSGYDISAKWGECTLDRKDVNKGYTPENCRWITNQEQQNNRRGNVLLEYNGEVHTMAEWSRLLGVTYSAISYHCRRKNRTIKQMLDIQGR